LNLFLRWMVRRDATDPGGWTMIPARQLVVPLDTHTIRVGKCLRFTRRVSPGWKMAAEITEALRAFDPDDPVRYDFALCHLSMMGGLRIWDPPARRAVSAAWTLQAAQGKSKVESQKSKVSRTSNFELRTSYRPILIALPIDQNQPLSCGWPSITPVVL
jgi:hypothetical protein